MYNRAIVYFVFVIFCLPLNAMAGFLEMPEITEMPELERKSMLKDLDIPSVRDRDPDPDSGPRLNVQKFKLQGIVEYPDLGITKKDIDALIESIRFELMQEYKVEKSGFTKTELEEVSGLLVEIEEDTMERHVSELEVQKLVWLIREQRSSRGITLGTIETVADRITRFYRERGFILAKAYIPRQEVRDGVVTLTLLLGTLGEINVAGNELYDSEFLASTFDNMITMPVTSSAVEENLYLLNDYPGLISTGFFEPGAQVGDTKLNLQVKAEKAYDFNVRMDNHGSEQTGQYRLYAEGLWNNPLGNADQIQIATLYTAEPSNTTYAQFRYSTRLFSPKLTIAAGISNNDFVLGAGNSETVNRLEIFGETTQKDVTLSYSLKRSRTASYYADIIFEEVESVLRIGSFEDQGDSGLDDIVRNTSLVFTYDVLDEEDKILHQGDVKLLSGQFELGAEQGQDEKYNILSANYSLLTFYHLPYFNANTRLIYRATLQYASSPLSSINQFALAGPTKVRGYPVNQFSADNAFYNGIDWIFDAPKFFDMQVGTSNLRKILSPFVFVDASWGQALSLVEGKDDVTGQLYDAGFGFQFSYQSHFHGSFQLAFPLNAKFSTDEFDEPNDSFKLVFDFQYSFR